jgi:hypothetical protein
MQRWRWPARLGVEKKNKKAEREAVTEEEEKLGGINIYLDVKQVSPSFVLFTFTMASYLEYGRKSTEA